MNPKIAKLREERERNAARIIALTERNKVIDGLVTELENTEIIGITREYEVTPEKLLELLAALKKSPIPVESEGSNE